MLALYPLGGASETAADTTDLVCWTSHEGGAGPHHHQRTSMPPVSRPMPDIERRGSHIIATQEQRL